MMLFLTLPTFAPLNARFFALDHSSRSYRPSSFGSASEQVLLLYWPVNFFPTFVALPQTLNSGDAAEATPGVTPIADMATRQATVITIRLISLSVLSLNCGCALRLGESQQVTCPWVVSPHPVRG